MTTHSTQLGQERTGRVRKGTFDGTLTEASCGLPSQAESEAAAPWGSPTAVVVVVGLSEWETDFPNLSQSPAFSFCAGH